MAYLTTAELAERIKFDVRIIRERLRDTLLLEGIHYIHPFGGRKILYLWEPIERDMKPYSNEERIGLPMAWGGVSRG